MTLCHILPEQRGWVNMYIFILFFYTLMATILCSKKTVRKSSHISFFCCGNTFYEVVWRPENTHGELTGQLEWSAGFSPTLEWPVDFCCQSKITDLILSFQIPCRNLNILFAHVFFCLWLVIGTYILPVFFPVICWYYLLIERSVILFAGNKLHFCLSCETTLLMLSCNHTESAQFIVTS